MLPLLLAALASTALAETKPLTVEKVIDGDTVYLDDQGETVKVRLLGIDCPESRAVSKCGTWREGLSCKDEIKLGKRAGARTKELLPLKTPVTMVTPPKNKKDRYGRTLGYVMLPDGRDVGLELVKDGLCKEWSDRYPHPRQDEYRDAAKR
jgi:micrococcal nuclease